MFVQYIYFYHSSSLYRVFFFFVMFVKGVDTVDVTFMY